MMRYPRPPRLDFHWQVYQRGASFLGASERTGYPCQGVAAMPDAHSPLELACARLSPEDRKELALMGRRFGQRDTGSKVLSTEMPESKLGTQEPRSTVNPPKDIYHGLLPSR